MSLYARGVRAVALQPPPRGVWITTAEAQAADPLEFRKLLGLLLLNRLAGRSSAGGMLTSAQATRFTGIRLQMVQASQASTETTRNLRALAGLLQRVVREQRASITKPGPSNTCGALIRVHSEQAQLPRSSAWSAAAVAASGGTHPRACACSRVFRLSASGAVPLTAQDELP